MRTLVTTALEETWPKDGAELLFLGEWCKTHKKKESWKELNSSVLEYHWDDREKLGRDYHYIQGIYEKILNDLSGKLNEIHSVHHSVRYWRIIVGPWLNYFLGMLFDRWQMLALAEQGTDSLECIVLEREYGELIPRDMAHFNSLYIEDHWNEGIYTELLTNFFSDSISIRKVGQKKKRKVQHSTSSGIFRRLKRYVLSKLDFSRKRKSLQGQYIIHGLVSHRESAALQLKLGQFPKFWHSYTLDKPEPSEMKRQWGLPSKSDVCDFEKIARSMISNHIPTLYLEGYAQAVLKVKTLNLPKRPELVCTSNGYSSDEFFKFWCAEVADAGSPVIIAQHGGHYGSGLFSATEEHEIKISDKYLTWGWSSPKLDKTLPVGNIKESAKKLKYDREGRALMVGMGSPRYSYRMYAIPVASQWLDYFEEQNQFVSTLHTDVVKQLLVRPYVRDYGWDMKSRWQTIHPTVQIDEGQKSIRNMISQTRIYIATYNATTYLESLLWDVPTIIFWNPNHWELRPEAKENYELLKSVGIFHESPLSAAAKINEVWDDVDLWWRSDAVQAARVQFCHEFSRPIYNRAEMFSEIFSMLKRSK